MLKRNLFDEAARVLAMPIPRRKAFKYVASGFAAAVLSFLWPKEVAAQDADYPCGGPIPNCGCDNKGCNGKKVDDPCKGANGKSGHCAKVCTQNTLSCCKCTPGPAPDAPNISSIPDVAITREDSLAAGNCPEGTDWVASWFPGRHSVPAREAAAAAIARGKPRLARYIARTAHLVDRGAQV
jgi:hypothetical protein